MPGTTTPLTRAQMETGLRKYKCKYTQYRSGWTRSRTSIVGRKFGPANGAVLHNFGSRGVDTNQMAYLYTGDGEGSAKPGPLSQFCIDDTGMIWIIGWGLCNHTGSIGRKTFDMVLNDQMPYTSEVIPKTSATSSTLLQMSGNERLYGCELLHGPEGPTAPQLLAAVQLFAAICDTHGWTAQSIVAHRECTTQRSDPQTVNIAKFRRDVRDLMLKVNTPVAKPPVPTTPSTPTTPTKPEVPVPTATEVTLDARPDAVPEGGTVELFATVKNKLAGTVQFQWYDAALKTWKNFNAPTAVVSGVARTTNTPSKDVIYRCIFTPQDKVKYAVDYSPNLLVEVVDIAGLRSELAQLKAQVAKLLPAPMTAQEKME